MLTGLLACLRTPSIAICILLLVNVCTCLQSVVELIAGEEGLKELRELMLWSATADRASLIRSLQDRTEETDSKGNTTIKLTPMSKRRSFWSVWMTAAFPALTKVAVRLMSMHVTSCAAERS